MPSAKPGRNDPCPCGSGKKYKKCCLDKDEAARKQKQAPPAVARGPAKGGLRSESALARAPAGRDLSPAELWWDAIIAEADDAKSADDAAALIARVIDPAAPAALRSDWLFDFLSPVFDQLRQAGRPAERMRALENIEERHPEAFHQSPAHFALMRFEAALDDGGGDLEAEARRVGPHLAAILDLADDLPARLAWEGRLPVLRALTEAAWPAIHESTDLMGSGVDAWADEGLAAVLLEHLERDPGVSADAPALLADLAPYDTPDAEPGAIAAFVRHYLPLLEPTGDASVDPAQLAHALEQRGRAALDLLDPVVAAVAARLRRERGWSRSRAWLLIRELGPLLVERAERAAKKAGAGPRTAGALALPPEAAFLDVLLWRNIGVFSRKTHVINAVVFALPAWAGEVAARGWVSPPDAGAWLRRLMDALGAAFAKASDVRRGDLAPLLAFVGGEGRELSR